MSKKIVLIGIASIVLLMIIVGAVLFFTHQGGSSAPLRIAFGTWPGNAVPYLAKAKGFFGDLEVDISVIDDTSARRAAFGSGSIDVMASTLDTYVFEAASGLKGKIISVIDESFGADGIVAKGEIQSIKDLKGKTVAYASGTPSHFFLLFLLRQEGLKSEDIKSFVVDDPGRAGEAFISGSVDAAVTWEPFLTQAANTPDSHVLISTKAARGLIVGILVANEKTMRERQNDLQTFINCWLKGIDYLKANPEESYNIMAKGFNIPVEDFKDMVLGLQYADLKRNKELFGTEGSKTSHVEKIFNAAGMFWKQEKVIDKYVTATEVIDNSFIEAVILKK